MGSLPSSMPSRPQPPPFGVAAVLAISRWADITRAAARGAGGHRQQARRAAAVPAQPQFGGASVDDAHAVMPPAGRARWRRPGIHSFLTRPAWLLSRNSSRDSPKIIDLTPGQPREPGRSAGATLRAANGAGR